MDSDVPLSESIIDGPLSLPPLRPTKAAVTLLRKRIRLELMAVRNVSGLGAEGTTVARAALLAARRRLAVKSEGTVNGVRRDVCLFLRNDQRRSHHRNQVSKKTKRAPPRTAPITAAVGTCLGGVP
jgi:hypothetical protein